MHHSMVEGGTSLPHGAEGGQVIEVLLLVFVSVKGKVGVHPVL